MVRKRNPSEALPPPLVLRPAAERGHRHYGWLDTWHTFSFGDYHDPRHMGFRALRVLNDDRVAPGAGFPDHPHRDMEIVTYVLEGALQHRDSLGNTSVIRAGEMQRMSAGTGVVHSEYNPSQAEPVHFLQIWIVPARQGLPPSYEQRAFAEEERRGRFRLVASPEGAERSLIVHQDARLYAALLRAGERTTYAVRPGRYAWVHIARGRTGVAGLELFEGDGVAVTGPLELEFEGVGEGEVLLFDLS